MAKICVHAVVSGRVQGVWFRHFTREQAEASALTGWVRNLPDGRVEAMLCGEEKAVRHVEAWLSQGPELANVAEVVSSDAPFDDELEGFLIRDSDAV
ncbi:acylphosphatase [Marinobacterium weihaiense]|uniref:Acylphosphatase n=1 Tax=Marinobacterium weihaiense TaxID=2851016 RepID=A0ABS6MBP9_9GAMM|nr:acylphosphatase [Marinobacterium weihaiense]MBV0933732.1 acylphosphatase [Marinobacterium weihaiense]